MNGPVRRWISPVLFVFLFLLITGAITSQAWAQSGECDADEWISTTTYSRGDAVSWDNHEWRAKRTTTGTLPGTHKPSWQDQGACSTEPPPEPPDEPVPTNIQIFGVWHAGNHYADWALPPIMAEFRSNNLWIIDRGDGFPSVNLVVLSFLHPMEVLEMDEWDVTTGVPAGMTQEIVDFFKEKGIRVMMSIGGVTYTDAWDEALETNAELLGLNAAAIADAYGVGIEIDYERNTGANLVGLDTFINAYRSVHPYNHENLDAQRRLTIDLAAGGRYLQELNRYATLNWLSGEERVLDYANAMVHRKSGSPENWEEHVTGMPTYDPVIPPKAPARFTGGLYLKGNMANCTDFYSSEQWRHADYVQSVEPAGAGSTNGMLGYMFWAAGTPSARKNYVPTFPPNSCEGGMGEASYFFQFPVPMEKLRQD